MKKEQTIKNQVKLSGVGLHTGANVNIAINPAPEGTGILFKRVDIDGAPCVKACPENLVQPDQRLQRTTLKKGRAEVHTTEHLLAALSGLGIDNVEVEIDGAEMPGLDGSAKEFVRVLEAAGIRELPRLKKTIEIKKPIVCKKGDAVIEIKPHSEFKIDYLLDYKHPILKKQSFCVSLDSSGESQEFFKEKIAPSRTFCLEEEANALLAMGLGKGANFKNTLVIGKEGPIANSFRFPDEPARHKVLDIIGDLYILGPVKGHITAHKSGHALNATAIKEIYNEHRRNNENNTA